MRIANHPSRYKSCFEPERMLNKPGLLVGRATCAELEWRLVKEEFFGLAMTRFTMPMEWIAEGG